jgi:predicted metal-dependent enzyme (double-stranded beta helix superfamily)
VTNSAPTRLDEPVRILLDRIAAPAASPTPDLAAIGGALSALARDTHYLDGWIERLGDRSASLAIHAPERGPRLMLVHRTVGQMSAVHDHGTWVVACPIVGVETHRRWQVVLSEGCPPGVELAEDVALEAAAVATLLPPDDVHDHGHLVGRGAPAWTLILLGDRQVRFTRNEWDLATGRHRVLEPGDGGRWVASDPWPDD